MSPNFSLCHFILVSLRHYGCAMPIPVSKVGVLILLTNQGTCSPKSAHDCRALVCLVSASYWFYYGRLNKTGIAGESGEGWQREGSQRYYRSLHSRVFIYMPWNFWAEVMVPCNPNFSIRMWRWTLSLKSPFIPHTRNLSWRKEECLSY